MECGLEGFICQPCLVDPLGCCIPGLWIGVCGLSKGHCGDLTFIREHSEVSQNTLDVSRGDVLSKSDE